MFYLWKINVIVVCSKYVVIVVVLLLGLFENLDVDDEDINDPARVAGETRVHIVVEASSS